MRTNCIHIPEYADVLAPTGEWSPYAEDDAPIPRSEFIAADLRHALCDTRAPTLPAPPEDDLYDLSDITSETRPTDRCPAVWEV